MKARILTGLMMAVAVVALIGYAPLAWFPWVILGLTGLTSMELSRLMMRWVDSTLPQWFVVPYCVMAVAAVMLFEPQVYAVIGIIVFLVAAIVGLSVSGTMEQRFMTSALLLFSVVYMCVGFGALLKLTQLEDARFWLIYCLAVTYGSDTGAFFAGKWLGRHLCAPVVSPKKTWEGILGGILAAIVAMFIVMRITLQSGPWIYWVVMTIVTAVFGILGDLSESVIKRAAGIKDSGALIPGHGGVLDRVDSLLFTAPVVYLCALYFFG